MQLRRIGELKLLREIRERFSSPPQGAGGGIVVGIGDDAAVIDPRNRKVLVTTDLMHEGVHFDLGYTSPFHLGFKLVSVNVSDIMAMGARPEYLFLDLSMKGDVEEDFFWALYRGISEAMETYGVRLLGGDLSSARHDMVLSATVLGSADGVVTRKGASAGDRIYVTGALGDSACGLEIVKRLAPESKETVQSSTFDVQGEQTGRGGKGILSLTVGSSLVTLDWKAAEPLIKRHLMPVARDSRGFAEHATAMIDVSDGLFIDLCRICDESGCGARVYLDRIPVSGEMGRAAKSMGLDPLRLATAGGEDYELLFTAPPTSPIPPLLRGGAGGVKVTCIGEITESGRIAVDSAGRESGLVSEGYQHFGASR